MAWNPLRHFGREEFREHVQNYACETMDGRRTPPIDGKIYLPYWWVRGEIRVFWEAGISQSTVDLIVRAVEERVQETINLPFRFSPYGAHPSAMGQVAQATINSQIDEKMLFKLALSESWRDPKCGGQQHADIYITEKQFLGDRASWGAADFKFGAMVFCLYGNRQKNQNFLRNVALHEANHLLGMYAHCDAYQNVQGFKYTPSCNMHYSCPSEKLCPKCTEFIQNWWLQVSYEYEQSYSG